MVVNDKLAKIIKHTIMGYYSVAFFSVEIYVFNKKKFLVMKKVINYFTKLMKTYENSTDKRNLAILTKMKYHFIWLIAGVLYVCKKSLPSNLYFKILIKKNAGCR